MRAHAFIATVVLLACNTLTGASGLSVGDVPPAPDAGEDVSPGQPITDASAEEAAEEVDDLGHVVFVGDADPGGTCPPFALFCDSFESSDFQKWTTLLHTNGGTATVVTSPVRSGAEAMHAFAPMGMLVDGGYKSVGAAARKTLAPFTTGLLVVRGYWYFPKALGNETTFIKIIAANGVDDMNLKISTNGGVIKEDSDVPGEGAELDGTKAPPVAKWFCVEWQVTIGSPNQIGHQVVMLDGEVILDKDDVNATTMGYATVMPGFAASYGGITQDMYIDDIAVATQPIGCQ